MNHRLRGSGRSIAIVTTAAPSSFSAESLSRVSAKLGISSSNRQVRQALPIARRERGSRFSLVIALAITS